MKYLNAITLLTFGWMPSLSAQVLTHRKLQRLPQSQVIPGQYVIELDPSIPDSQGFAEKVLKRTFRKNIIETYDYAMKGFAVKDVPDMVLNFILNMDDVLSVSEDGIVEIEAIQNNPTWGLDLVDGSDDNRYTYTYTGRGVDVYIVDTGIQANHPDFEGRVRSCVSYTGESCGSDLNGHGTHVAGTVGSKTYGVAKQVSLHDVKVLNQRGSGSYSGVIAGVDYVTKIKENNRSRRIVINMSLAGGVFARLNSAIDSAAAQGVVVVVAAGNSGADACNASPASASGALVVGAINDRNQRTSWSNWGSCVDIFAPGTGILSTAKTGGTSTKSGTSMASPHVAGVAALYLESGRNTNSITSDARTGQLGNLEGSPNRLVRTSRLPARNTPQDDTDAPVRAPTRPPTRAPVPAPTRRPTRAPTRAPVPAPTRRPTRAPTRAPVPAPTRRPTRAPTRAPTRRPTRAPTRAPVPAPTRRPTRVLTRAPVTPRTREPTRAPVPAPTQPPVAPQCLPAADPGHRLVDSTALVDLNLAGGATSSLALGDNCFLAMLSLAKVSEDI